MSEPEIEQFIIVFKSFMDHASVEELNYLQREARENIIRDTLSIRQNS